MHIIWNDPHWFNYSFHIWLNMAPSVWFTIYQSKTDICHQQGKITIIQRELRESHSVWILLKVLEDHSVLMKIPVGNYQYEPHPFTFINCKYLLPHSLIWLLGALFIQYYHNHQTKNKNPTLTHLNTNYIQPSEYSKEKVNFIFWFNRLNSCGATCLLCTLV